MSLVILFSYSSRLVQTMTCRGASWVKPILWEVFLLQGRAAFERRGGRQELKNDEDEICDERAHRRLCAPAGRVPTAGRDYQVRGNLIIPKSPAALQPRVRAGT
jgi:hypothetical protein